MTIVTRFPTVSAADQFVNPNNAFADDDVDSTGLVDSTHTPTQRWGTYGFDAAIPALATITKVQLIIEALRGNAIADVTLDSLARIGGVDQTSHFVDSPSTTRTVFTIDITADRAWTRADLLDAVFQSKVTTGWLAGSDTFSIDYLSVEVTYITSPGAKPHGVITRQAVNRGSTF